MAKRARHTGKGFIRRRIMGNRPLEWTVSEEEIQFRFHMLPEGWMKKTEKLCGRLLEAVAEAPGGNQIWMAPELRNILGKTKAGAVFSSLPVPEPALMRLLWKQQGFFPYMTIIMPDFGKEDFYEEIEAEAELVREFLEGDYDGLNGLLLVSRALEKLGYAVNTPSRIRDSRSSVQAARLLRVPGEAYVLICGPVTGLRSAVCRRIRSIWI